MRADTRVLLCCRSRWGPEDKMLNPRPGPDAPASALHPASAVTRHWVREERWRRLPAAEWERQARPPCASLRGHRRRVRGKRVNENGDGMDLDLKVRKQGGHTVLEVAGE